MRKLARKKSHRESLMRNLITSLIIYEKVDTTLAKAKELKNYAEKIISKAKKSTDSDRRYIYGRLFDKNAAKKLIEEIVPRYRNRTSGFAALIKLKNRLGDNSPTARVELVDKKTFVEDTTAKDNKEEKIKLKTKKVNEQTKQ